MGLKVDHELVPSGEILFDTMQEQGIELDYILPDYCPEVYKIIGCTASTGITDYCLDSGRLTYELCADITVIYYDEQEHRISTVRQKQIYSKSADTGVSETDAEISIYPRTDYINCRAVNKRRLDIKGVISVQLILKGEKKTDVISSANGMNVHFRKQNIEFAAEKNVSVKYLSIDENIEVSSSGSEISGIIRSECVPSVKDIKMLSDKIIIKGDCVVRLAYTALKDGVQSVETMTSSLPFTQIIDMKGNDENARCLADIRTVMFDAVPGSDKKEQTVKCSITLCIACSVYRPSFAGIITDIFSTRYSCSTEYADLRISGMPETVKDTFTVKTMMESSPESIGKIYDVWCRTDNVAVHERKTGDGHDTVSGILKCFMLLKNQSGEPAVINRESEFEYIIPDTAQYKYEVSVIPSGCSYSIKSDESAEVTAELSVCGFKQSITYLKALVSAETGDEDEKNDTDCALKIYFCSDDESVWDIAKRFRTSEDEIISANDLTDDTVKAGCMLMVPITR